MSDTIGRVKAELKAALASGAIAVTPNRRLARHLRNEFATDALAQGRTTWVSPTILPYGAWLRSLWLDLLAADAMSGPRRLLRPVQSMYAWQRIVAADARNAGVDARSAAKLAADAWELLHAWGAGGESWRGWPALSLSDDQAAFVSWSESYAAKLAGAAAIDEAQLADALAQNATALAKSPHRRVLLVAFIEQSPQQMRLITALAAAGAAQFEHVDTLPSTTPGAARRAAGTTPRDELARALTWARNQIAAAPDARVGIAVADLAMRRAEARSLAEDILCPDLQWPGRETTARPFNISLGEPLADVPLVSVALDLIELGLRSIPLARAASILRSPHLAGAQASWSRRSAIEARWLDQGRRDISFGEASAAVSAIDPMLAERWRRAKDARRLPAAASPRDWVEAWRDWLEAIGWPGDTSLSSAQYQARRAWDDLLVEFGAVAAMDTRLLKAEALALLRALAKERLFQPEAPDAPVQILGLLEAQGLQFDALWVSGLTAERWPPEPEPDALLPITWQREHGLPRSSAARELAYAQMLTERFRRSAARVVFSHAEGTDETRSAPSTLIRDLPLLGPDETRLAPTAAEIIRAAAPVLEAVDDRLAPPPVRGQPLSGGAGLFEKQSDCPFRAVAIHRLGAELWPEAPEGLSAMERGDLLHRVFAALWEGLRNSAMLAAEPRDALEARVAAAVTQAMSSSAMAARRRALPPLVAELEAQRLVNLTLEWIEKHERSRAPFRVVDTELKLALAFEAFRIDLRLDRVDAFDSGGVAIIDYKSGRVVRPARWFDPRPQAPQLALYALAWRRARPYDRVRAVAYAQVKRGELKLEGLAADDTAWPELTRPDKLRGAGLGDWGAVEMRWADSLAALGDEIGRGYAAVAPRDRHKTCQRCRLYALCRIGTPEGGDEGTADDDA